MRQINVTVLNITVAILDFLYRNHDIQRFWVLEVIARAPYFAFLSVLHYKESLGLRTEAHFHLMKEHFYQTVNETETLNKKWKDVEALIVGLIASRLSFWFLSTIGVTWGIILLLLSLLII